MTEEQKVIYEIQDYLRNISFYDKRIPFIVSDGIFGSETTQAIKIFQENYGLESDGKVDFATWNKLVEANNLAVETLIQPFRSAPIENSDLPLKIGDRNRFVKHLNLMLSKLGEDFSNFNVVQNYDVFNINTENQVKRWQRVISVAQTGQVDKATWNMLSLYYLL